MIIVDLLFGVFRIHCKLKPLNVVLKWLGRRAGGKESCTKVSLFLQKLGGVLPFGNIANFPNIADMKF